MDHLTEDLLLQFTVGTLDVEEVMNCKAHLEACDACRTRQQSISSIVFSKTMQAPLSPPRPATLPDAPNALATSTNTRLLERGRSLGRYVLLDRLAAGGMGEVFSAYDPHLDRRVALKLLRTGTTSAEEGQTRLLREAQAMARLQHPNVVAVHDVGTLGDQVFIAMEFVEGETLTQWMRGSHSFTDIIRLFLGAGSGLSAAHAAGLIHRDFKPDNVIIGTDGRPRVVDFGLARQASNTPAPEPVAGELVPEAVADSSLAVQLTKDGAVLGTPGYMAPEQIAGLPTDARSDQFSFCVALFEALYGKRPFGGATLKQHAHEIAQNRIVAVPSNADVPEHVADAIRQGLKANPNDRFADMAELLAALRPKARRRWRSMTAIIALAVITTAAVGYGVWTQQRLRICGTTDAELKVVWNDEVRAAIGRAFSDSRISFAATSLKSVEKSLDAYAKDWSRVAKNACEDGRVRHVDSEELYSLKHACLDRGLRHFKTLTQMLRTADKEIISNAASAAASLDPVQSCTDTATLSRQRVNGPSAAQETALSNAVLEARTLFDSGQYARGAAMLRETSLEGGSARSQADALLWLGRLELRSGNPKGSRATNLRAVEAALRAGDAALEARALSRLYGNEGYDEADAEADVWNRLAIAAAARAEGNWEVEYELVFNHALVALGRKQWRSALADYEKALRLVEEHLGAEHPDVASLLNNMGVALVASGDYEAAIERYRRALALHTALEGADHPNTAIAEANLAFVLRKQGHYAKAIEAYEHALSVRRSVLGPDHPEALKTAEALAKVLTQVGRHDEAMKYLQASLDTRRRISGPESKEVAQTLDLLAELYVSGGFWKEAKQVATQELAIAEAATGVDGAAAASALTTLGTVETELGLWSDARKHLDRALTIRSEKSGKESSDAASVLSALAALELAQNHPEPCATLAQQSLTIREKAGAAADVIARDLMLLGRARAMQKQLDLAAPLLERCVKLRETLEAPQLLAEAQLELGKVLWLSQPDDRSDAESMIVHAFHALATPDKLAAVKELKSLGIDMSSDAGH